MFLITLASAFAATWGTVDFRILPGDDPTVFPLVIDVENYLAEEFEAELYVTTLDPAEEWFGESDMTKVLAIPEDPNLLYIDFPVTEQEIYYDVWVMVEYDEEVEDVIYNSLVRVKEETITSNKDLPALPGEQLKQEIEQALEDFEEEYGDEEYTVQEIAQMELEKEMENNPDFKEEYLESMEELGLEPDPEILEQADEIKENEGNAPIWLAIIIIILAFGVVGVLAWIALKD